MSIDSAFDSLPPENPYHGDPTLPYFQFPPEKADGMVAEMVAKGMTEERARQEVTRQEAFETNKLVQDKFAEEQRRVA